MRDGGKSCLEDSTEMDTLYKKKKYIYIYIYFVLLNDMGQGLSSTETFTRGYKTSIDFWKR